MGSRWFTERMVKQINNRKPSKLPKTNIVPAAQRRKSAVSASPSNWLIHSNAIVTEKETVQTTKVISRTRITVRVENIGKLIRNYVNRLSGPLVAILAIFTGCRPPCKPATSLYQFDELPLNFQNKSGEQSRVSLTKGHSFSIQEYL